MPSARYWRYCSIFFLILMAAAILFRPDDSWKYLATLWIICAATESIHDRFDKLESSDG